MGAMETSKEHASLRLLETTAIEGEDARQGPLALRLRAFAVAAGPEKPLVAKLRSQTAVPSRPDLTAAASLKATHPCLPLSCGDTWVLPSHDVAILARQYPLTHFSFPTVIHSHKRSSPSPNVCLPLPPCRPWPKMAQEQDTVPHSQPAPPPPPTLEDQADLAQATIAALLPDGDEEENRLCLSRVSQTLLHHHGGTITCLTLRWRPGHRYRALLHLIERQHHLHTLHVRKAEAIPALIYVLLLGGLRHIPVLSLAFIIPDSTTLGQVRSLTCAFHVPGTLQGLQTLRLLPTHPGMIPPLARALASGAAPFLHSLELSDGPSIKNDDMEALAAMLEARTNLSRDIANDCPSPPRGFNVDERV